MDFEILTDITDVETSSGPEFGKKRGYGRDMDKDTEENVRDSLSLTNGDIVEVEIY